MNRVMTLLDEMIEWQREKLLKCGRSFVPTLTSEDVLQPIDYSQLEENPYFRYEEGVLEGLLSVKASLLSLKRCGKFPNNE